MIINTNVSALNTYNRLTANNEASSKSLEKLSSGFRINRAGDDAAGLAISEKMRGQIRGLEMATKNAQDGVSMIQTAEGALNESHSILQRMRELAVQSANDTNTEADRAELQKEVDQLTEELSRIANDTEFNTQKLLDGTFEGTIHIGANQGQNVELAINKMDSETLGVAGVDGVELSLTSDTVTGNDGTDGSATDGANWGALGDASTYNVIQLEEEVAISGDELFGVVNANYALTDTNGDVVAVSNDGQVYTALETATAQDNLGTADLYEDDAAALAWDFGGQVTSGTVTTAAATNDLTLTSSTGSVEFADSELASGTYRVVDNNHALITGSDLGLVDSDNNLVAISTDGRDWNDMLGNDLFDVPTNTAALVVDNEINISSSGGIDISSQAAADGALTTIQSAIDAVSAERSKLGAYQNRLEHTINNLGTSAENLTAAESRIRDVDMAKEMMAFTKNNILQQAATAMLAQANQQPQSVLQLLQ